MMSSEIALTTQFKNNIFNEIWTSFNNTYNRINKMLIDGYKLNLQHPDFEPKIDFPSWYYYYDSSKCGGLFINEDIIVFREKGSFTLLKSEREDDYRYGNFKISEDYYRYSTSICVDLYHHMRQFHNTLNRYGLPVITILGGFLLKLIFAGSQDITVIPHLYRFFQDYELFLNHEIPQTYLLAKYDFKDNNPERSKK